MKALPRILPLVFLWIGFCLLAGCASSPRKESSASSDRFLHKRSAKQAYRMESAGAPPPSPMEAQEMVMAESDDGWQDSPSPAYVMENEMRAPRAQSTAQPDLNEMPRTTPPPGVELPLTNPETSRMVHYDGYIQHRNTRPESALDSIEVIAKIHQGYVERRSALHIAIRVPVENFMPAYEDVLRLGNILDKSISANDITDQFHDTQLSIRVAQATLAKLRDILARTEKDKEKLRLLQEIQRLAENLERLESRKKALQLQADFSTIQVQIQNYAPTHRPLPSQEFSGFGWISGLNPFGSLAYPLGKFQDFAVPTGFVEIDNKDLRSWLWFKKQWQAASPEGSRFWARRLKNQPKGNSQFWVEAIKTRLSEGFGKTETKKIGNFEFIEFTSESPAPYYYFVGVMAEKKCFYLVEFYFPNAQQKEKYQAALEKSLQKGPL